MARSKRIKAVVEVPVVPCCERCRAAFGSLRTGSLGSYVVRQDRIRSGFCVQCSMFVFPSLRAA